MAKWHFKEHDGYGDITQSSSGEAFEGSAAKNLATSLVRESVQNLLDVLADENEPARVRFTVVEKPDSRSATSQWFDGLMDHLVSPGAGLPDPPNPGEPCRYLLIEDFNTQGLVGDYKAPYVPGTENNFVNFLYHDGLTGKVDKKLGSRGVGKIVLPHSSRAKTFFAYTIRAGDPDGEPLIVGKSLLKFRKVNGKSYDQASYFLNSWPTQGPREPVSEKETVARFKRDFSLSRVDETGLSIVVPYLDESVTLDGIRRAVVEEYHFAILDGKLLVEISDGQNIQQIDADHIPDLGEPELSARIALVQYAISHPDPVLQTIVPPAGTPQSLKDDLVPDGVRAAILNALNEHDRIAVRCHLHIHPKDSQPVPTWCDLYFEHAENFHKRPVFMRGLLPISGVGKPCSQLLAIVVVRPGPLANLLRAAEGANHTEWSPRTDNFKKAYKGRLGEIDFVSTCVNRIIEIARGNATEPVGGISTAFFSAPLEYDGGKSSHKGKKKPGAKPEKPDIPDMAPEPVGYLFNQEVGGFSLCGDPEKPAPGRITVRVAYDVIRGSAWSEYDPDDFDFRKTKGDVLVVVHNAEIERPDPGNRLIIKPTSSDFKVNVTGFNEHLDIVVDHRRTDRPRKKKGATDAGETPELHQSQQAHT